MRAGLDAADEIGVPLVVLEGDPGYYRRFGFVDATQIGIRPPSLRIPAGAQQARRLDAYQDWMTGTFVYRDVFWDHDFVGLRDWVP